MNRLLKISISSFIILIIFLIYCHLETRWLKINHVVIRSSDIPVSFDGKKIVFISDIHHGPYLSIERVQKLVKQINDIQPDIILLGGDYVHREMRYIIPFFNEIKKLKSVYGIFAVLGNHDHWEDAELTKKMMLENGIKLCDNNSFWVNIGGDSIKIGGVGDMWEDIQLIDSTIHDIKKKDFCVLLSHNPDYLEKLNTDKVDLTLSGHTHGGQVTFLGFWAPIVPSKYGQKYRYGLKKFGEMQSYITSGVGSITPPLRFFCRPEIVVIKLKSNFKLF